MKALAIILAIIGGLCLFKILPATVGSVLALVVCIVAVLVFYWLFRLIFRWFKKCKKKIDDYCDDDF